ncbi:MAG: tetratricopeptide repeat protein [Planctomycetes bacterium]|nr:tetratricopeptide repeat protein [Planctomycetota bacterium]
MIRRAPSFAIFALLLSIAPGLAFAQAPAPEATADDPRVTQAMADMQKGSWNTAIKELLKIVADTPDSVEAHLQLARAYRAVGQYDDADRETAEGLRREPKNLDALHVAMELHLARGRYDEARKVGDQALAIDAKDVHALRYQGLSLIEQGKRDEAREKFQAVVEIAKAEKIEDSSRLCDVADALWKLGGDQEVVDALDDAKKSDPIDPEPNLLLGAVLLEKYEDAQAIKELRLLLQRNPGSADAHAGLIDCYHYRGESFQEEEECDAALAINRNLVPALQASAVILLGDLKFAEAKAAIDKALAVNPASNSVLAARAAYEYLTNDRAKFEATCAHVLSVDPKSGDIYFVVGEALASRMRFAEALALCKKAVEIDPKLWKAWVSVGKYSFNTGDEEGGIAALKKAQEGDPWEYPWRENMLTLADYLKEFVTVTTPHFQIRIHVEEKQVLAEYLPPLLEEAWDAMVKRYEFTPKTPILVEVFPEQRDFAVRTIGMEGISGILGACFGSVITLDSPRAFRNAKTGKPMPPPFSWARTTWHEFAHVMALQMSKSRVPRWFTEGLSTWEERRSRFDWDREMDYDLFLAEANGTIIPLAELNAAFRTNRIIFAYFQGGLICEFIETTYGWDKILKMLKLFGDDKQTPEVVKEVLGLTPEEFDRKFLDFVHAKTAIVHAFPVYEQQTITRFRHELESKPKDADLLLKLAWGYFWQKKATDCGEMLDRALRIAPENPSALALRGYLAFNDGQLDKAGEFLKKAAANGARDFILHQKLAQLAKRAKKPDEAIAEYQAAKADFPRFVGDGNPYTELEALYRAKEMPAEAQRELENYVTIQHNDFKIRRQLADAYGEKEDWKKQLQYLEEINWVNPFDVDLHTELATTYQKLGRLDAACRELRVAIALTERESSADLHARLAELYDQRGMSDEARAEAQEALRIQPDNERATKLLDRKP